MIISDNSILFRGATELARKFSYFAEVMEGYGPPPLWQREQGFHTLVHIILEQQVSLNSAKAAYDKLEDAIGKPEPAKFLQLDDAELKRIGFSRQKTSYCRGLAETVSNGGIKLETLSNLSDEDVRKALTAIKGIGPWTANIYLLMALGRPDVWPAGDLALEVGYQKLRGLATKPSAKELAKISMQWKPLRAIAARLIYHFYLSS